jgi:hypothetical protein
MSSIVASSLRARRELRVERSTISAMPASIGSDTTGLPVRLMSARHELCPVGLRDVKLGCGRSFGELACRVGDLAHQTLRCSGPWRRHEPETS